MCDSAVQEFYKDQTVFVTGATGLLGKHLISKLLDSCWSLRKIYVLLRDKKGKTAKQRLDALLEDPWFAPLKGKRPNFEEKISVVSGDCALPDLGLNPADWNLLKDEVNIVIHVCAVVKFDEAIPVAGRTNTRAVKDILRLAKELQRLKAFVYVSTAFCNYVYGNIVEEEFYEPPMPPEEFLDMLDASEEEVLDTSKILGKWPNTYTFTKALAENLVRTHGKGLPAAVVRPAIVLGPVKEPQPGAYDKPQGMLLLLMAIYLGILHCVKLGKNFTAPVVPSDYTVNNVLAAAWDAASARRRETVAVYNYAGSSKNQLSWRKIIFCSDRFVKLYPSMTTVWWPFYIFTNNGTLISLVFFLAHTLPAYVADFLLILLGKKPRVVDVVRKVREGTKQLEPFCSVNWKFENANVERMWGRMNAKDRELFNFNMDDLEWESYFQNVFLSVRANTLKEPIENLPRARRKIFLFGVLHYSIVGLLLWVAYFMMKFTVNVGLHIFQVI